jgi:N-acetylglutamate synthase-like GNAT family acetyltransferase
MSDAQLAAELSSDATAFIALEHQGQTIGIAELHFGGEQNTEIVTFGVVPEATGTGAAGCLMEAVLARAFKPGISRVWLHTCSFDHPAAIHFYLKRGFRAYKFAIEVVDDPRLTGALPPTAAPHVPMIAQPGPARRD